MHGGTRTNFKEMSKLSLICFILFIIGPSNNSSLKSRLDLDGPAVLDSDTESHCPEQVDVYCAYLRLANLKLKPRCLRFLFHKGAIQCALATVSLARANHHRVRDSSSFQHSHTMSGICNKTFHCFHQKSSLHIFAKNFRRSLPLTISFDFKNLAQFFVKTGLNKV